MPPVGSVSAPVIIGRDRELAVIRSLLQPETGGGTVLLSGEAGLGKSRLLREAIREAEALGYRVLSGACFDRDQSLPYAPFLDLLRAYAVHAEDARERLAIVAPGFARLLPEMATLVSPPREDLAPEQERRRLFHEMEALLTGLAAEQPLFVTIEDIHWSDETSLELLLYLSRRAATARLALLLTYRGDERGVALSPFLAEIDRARAATEIPLHPLTPSGVEQQIRAILDLDRPAGAVFVRSLHNLTGGNPFFVEEVLRSLIAEGDIYPSDAGWQRRPLDQLRVPRGVEDAVQRRAALLGPTAREVLTLAAVAGRRVDFALLQALSGQNEDALVAAIKELIAAQLLVEVSPDVFAFRHALMRQAVYAELLGRERRRLHARVARAIESGAAGSPDAAREDLAYHHFEAGSWERAGVLARAAGERASALYAPLAAVEHYTRAIAATVHQGATPEAHLLQARGQAHDALGDFEAAHADYEAALAAANEANDRAAALTALLALGLLWSGRDYDQALAWLQQAIDLARMMNDPAALAHALNRLGNWHANHEEIDAALRCHDEALAIFARLADRRGEAETLDLLAMTRSLGGDLVGSSEAGRRAVRLFDELGDRQGLAGAVLMAATPNAVFELAMLAGGTTLAAGIAAGERALALAREIDWRSGEAFFMALLGEVWAAAGHFGQALALLQESIDIAEEIDHRQWIVQARWGLGECCGAMLAPERQRTEMERTLALSREIHSRNWISSAAAGLAWALTRLGELEAAEALLEESLFDSTPMRTQSRRLLWAARANLALRQDEPQLALAIADRLYATALNLTAERDIPQLALLKAAALAALARLGEAEALLRGARETAQTDGALPTLLSVHVALADVLRGQGRTDDARVEVAAAREIANQLAATIPAGELRDGYRRAVALLMGETAEAEAETTAPTSRLTAREREVAAYVAAGRSNREIAGLLFVSERTVEAHVANILRKLGVPSRSGIAAWVTRQGITPPAT